MKISFQLLRMSLPALLMISGISQALGDSTFQFLLDPESQIVAPDDSVSASLILRETFDGTGSELLDSTDGPGLFSFSLSITQDLIFLGISLAVFREVKRFYLGFYSWIMHKT